MMTNITKDFTYNTTDDQYSMTNHNAETATLTYSGPAVKYAVFDSSTNMMTGGTIPEIQWDNGAFNEQQDGYYAARIDCNEHTLVCALMVGSGGINPEDVPEIDEPVPGSALPYRRNDPILPDHTYEVREIEFDPATQTFVTPFPWKAPIETWEHFISLRNKALNSSDLRVTDDLPTSLYNQVVKYRKYLRDLPETGGAAWKVTLGTNSDGNTLGAGYSVGDGLLINDPAYKNDTSAPDILLTVNEVSDTGVITGFTTSSTHCYNYYLPAATKNNMFYTTNSAGSGAQINLTKTVNIPPHKITLIRCPIENNDQFDGHSPAIDNLPD
jgi:hypothetical protein|tara:strand:+ start:68 stop:1048 length:981 start_codon:yes stop_codon:yes gene_type:complete